MGNIVTIHDIAKQLGINSSTVSRALSGRAGVSEELRAKILARAEELGYRPNLMARYLRQQSSNVIGLVMDEEFNWYISTLAQGVQSAAKELGFSVMIWNAPEIENQKAGLELFEQLRLAGVILASSYVSNRNPYLKSSLPTVCINRTEVHDTINFVHDDEHGAVLGILHLISLGHKRIGFINGPSDWSPSISRYRGVKHALSSAGLDFDEALYACGDWFRDSAYREAIRMLSLPDRPTAIFAANDLMAVGVYQAARELGLDIPHELSVLGYNDDPLCTYLVPELTTIDLANKDIGYQAAKTLFSQFTENTESCGPTAVKGELIVRGSTHQAPRSI
ncbi:LacI family DNA-binding transcriptional regulator [Alicyclobacillus sp. SO9]|uniref:LacI family DNA-binding transcriptional regulator n=1 Tax=Alicyclobacillus sp. SO9 TaxID=2665646 RepID=UPI001E30D8E4|nr:LacI family DNA-binding transcriptional regulator [Alicyclobacillus sp. SO9]